MGYDYIGCMLERYLLVAHFNGSEFVQVVRCLILTALVVRNLCVFMV